MKLTEEQFNALLPYEKNFETMVRHRWARNPGSSALDLMNDIYEQVTGTKNKLNKGCQHCIMRLLTELGTIFLADLEEFRSHPFGIPPEETPDAIPETNEAKTEIFPQKEESPAPLSEIPEKPKKKTSRKKANETH